jgi:adenylate kinase
VNASHKEIFIFIGPPGAGKGTLAYHCINRMGWLQCSTGALCRKHVAEGTSLGKEIDLLIKSGKLISDSLIIEMVEQWLLQNRDRCTKIILDGIPRTLVQARLLDNLLSKPIFSDFSLSVIRMELDSDVVVKRLVSRLICANSDCCAVYSTDMLSEQDHVVCAECAAPLMRRSDDVEQVIRDRLAVYYAHADELVAYYERAGLKINSLNVLQPIEKVYDQFISLMDLRAA